MTDATLLIIFLTSNDTEGEKKQDIKMKISDENSIFDEKSKKKHCDKIAICSDIVMWYPAFDRLLKFVVIRCPGIQFYCICNS